MSPLSEKERAGTLFFEAFSSPSAAITHFPTLSWKCGHPAFPSMGAIVPKIFADSRNPVKRRATPSQEGFLSERCFFLPFRPPFENSLFPNAHPGWIQECPLRHRCKGKTLPLPAVKIDAFFPKRTLSLRRSRAALLFP